MIVVTLEKWEAFVLLTAAAVALTRNDVPDEDRAALESAKGKLLESGRGHWTVAGLIHDMQHVEARP